MTPLEALILGLVQGLTEFLPISSSGHLALAEHMLGLRERGVISGVFVDVAVHVATLAAVLVAFREPVMRLAAGVLRGERDALALLGLYAVASVPAAVVGLAVRDWIDTLYESLWFLGGAFLVLGVILWSVKGRMTGTGQRPDLWEALAIGVAQAVAIAPGISRSGTTIAVGLWRRMDPIAALEFSFVLGIPAIAGAALLELGGATNGFDHVGAVPLAIAFAASFVSGLAAIAILRKLLRVRAFHRFAPYVWAVGVLTLAGALLGGR